MDGENRVRIDTSFFHYEDDSSVVNDIFRTMIFIFILLIQHIALNKCFWKHI